MTKTERGQQDAAMLAKALESGIFNSSNFSSIAADAKGVIQIFNVGAERMLGYSAAEVVGTITLADISDPQEVTARAQDLSLELGTPIAAGFEALVFKAALGIEDIYDLTYVRKDGSRFPAVVSVTALRDTGDALIGYLLIGTDNTARKQVEAERQQLLLKQKETNRQLQLANVTLRDSEDKLSVTLNSVRDAVMATDAGARVTLMNPVAEHLTGWMQGEAAGHPIGEVFHIINQETRQPAALPVMETLAYGTVQGLANHTIVIARDGRECAITDTCAPICNPDGQVVGAVLVFRDVTAEHAAQQALHDKNVALEGAENLAEKANLAKSEFFSSMSHELRTPLNAILGFAQLMESASPPPTPPQKRNIDQILKAGWYLLDLINEILDLARIESGTATVSQEPVAPGEITLRLQVAPDTPLRTVLYVEDNHANLEQVEQLFARRPELRLLSAVDGTLGIECARVYQPEVILMDINLPGISGLEAVKRLRADVATAHIPVIALSANAVPRDIEKALEAGFESYLTKPIKVNQFMDALDTALLIAHRGSGRAAGVPV